MDGWMDIWMDGWIDGWDSTTYRLIDSKTTSQ